MLLALFHLLEHCWLGMPRNHSIFYVCSVFQHIVYPGADPGFSTRGEGGGGGGGGWYFVMEHALASQYRVGAVEGG